MLATGGSERCRSGLALRRRGDLHRNGLAAVVVAAGRTDVMGALQLVAVIALHERRRREREVRAALALASLGYLSLGNAHAD
jgi:hypothetical protein